MAVPNFPNFLGPKLFGFDNRVNQDASIQDQNLKAVKKKIRTDINGQ